MFIQISNYSTNLLEQILLVRKGIKFCLPEEPSVNKEKRKRHKFLKHATCNIIYIQTERRLFYYP